jgi:hypothetical protein
MVETSNGLNKQFSGLIVLPFASGFASGKEEL